VFGVSKAITNLFAGALGDRFGRKPVLVVGWLVAIPVPLLLMWAPTWGWVLFANALLGINQGLTWSLTVIMKIDLVGPARRGPGHGPQRGRRLRRRRRRRLGDRLDRIRARAAPRTVLPRHRLRHHRPRPVRAVRPGDRRPRRPRGANHVQRRHPAADLTPRQVFALSTWRNRRCRRPARPGWSTTSTRAWPGACSRCSSPPPACPWAGSALLIAIAPAVWGVGQLFTGALSDKVGRKWLIAGGQWTEATGLAIIALGDSFGVWAASAAPSSAPAPPWPTRR
jgi:hypothetical protein